MGDRSSRMSTESTQMSDLADVDLDRSVAVVIPNWNGVEHLRRCLTGLAHQRGNGEPDVGQYDGNQEVFSACGCATLYRCEMLADVGDFDDAFFAYYEDVDLCLRARLRSWRGTYVGTAVVEHAVSATSGS